MDHLSKLREAFHPTTRVVIVYVGDHVWGIFSSHGKAEKALELWSLHEMWEPRITTYELDWRNRKAPPPKYLSDTITTADSTSPNRNSGT